MGITIKQPNKAQKFWNEQSEWSQATFGTDTERGPLGALKHLEKEAKEAQREVEKIQRIQSNTDSSIADSLNTEIADCLFLTFDAARRAGMTLDSLLDTAFRKLEINKQRKWNKPTSDEPVEHVRS